MKNISKKSLDQVITEKRDRIVEVVRMYNAAYEELKNLETELNRESLQNVYLYGEGLVCRFGFFSLDARKYHSKIEKQSCPPMPDSVEEFMEYKAEMEKEKETLGLIAELWKEILHEADKIEG